MIGIFRRVHRDERGITFVELVIALGVAGIISAVIVATIFQVATLNTRASSHMIAVRQVQQAGKEVSRDVFQAQTIKPATEDSGFPLLLEWRDLDDRLHKVVYDVRSYHNPNTLIVLERVHEKYDGDELLSSQTSIVARHIDTCPDKTNVSMRLSDDFKTVLVFTVTATMGEQSETRVYEVKPRPHQ